MKQRTKWERRPGVLRCRENEVRRSRGLSLSRWAMVGGGEAVASSRTLC